MDENEVKEKETKSTKKNEEKKVASKSIKSTAKSTTKKSDEKKKTAKTPSKKENAKEIKQKEEMVKENVEKLNVKEEKISSEKKQDDFTFKKVENVNIKKDKKEGFISKLFKAILIVIIIFIVLYCVMVMRNYFVISEIQEKINQLDNITSYSFISKSLHDGQESTHDVSKNEDIGRVELTTILESGEENKIIEWTDFNSNERILSFVEEKKATKLNTEIEPIGLLNISNFPFQLKKIKDNFKWLSLYTLMYSENLNGKECYVIQDFSGSKLYVDKENGVVVKNVTGSMETEIIDIKLNNVNEIYKPDLTGYEITEQK